MYIDKLDDTLNRYNNTYHSAIKMKPVDVNPDMHVEYNKENNKEGSKFKVGDHARISEYKNIFAKDFVPNWSEEIFVIKKIKNTLPWRYAISDLNG